MGYPRIAAMNIIHSYYPLEEFLSSVQSSGYELVELWTGPMHFRLDASGHDPIDDVAAALRRHDLALAAVCPEQNNPKPHNIAARGSDAQTRTYGYFANAIAVAEALGASKVVVTPGWAFLDEPRQVAWGRAVRMLASLSVIAEHSGVRLVLEALQLHESKVANTAEDLARMIDEVASPALAACLDIGAMERAGDTIDSYFAALGNRVAHCHLVDCGDVTHLAWGDGHRNMRADLDALVAHGYDGVCSVETYNERYLADPARVDARAMDIYRKATEVR